MKFAELTVGSQLRAGPRVVGEAEIIEFATRYDPQSFHIDREAAAASRWKGLISSGWLTCSVAMQLAVQSLLKDSDSLGSPGLDNIEWPHPVRPGDALSLVITVLEARRSSSGQVGIAKCQWEMRNQHDVAVLRMLGTSLFDLGRAS
jgi:acyl dehydratase